MSINVKDTALHTVRLIESNVTVIIDNGHALKKLHYL